MRSRSDEPDEPDGPDELDESDESDESDEGVPAMSNRAHRAGQAALVAVTSASMLAFATSAHAQDDDGDQQEPPGYEAPEPPEVDPNAPGLMLSDGAELAEPRMLDIKFVSEDAGGGDGGGGGSTGGGTTGGGGSTGGGGDPDPGDNGTTPDDGEGGQREEVTPGQRKFTLQTDVLFAEGSGEISGEAEESLAEVAEAIDQYQPAEVNIFGFTDNQGSYESGVVLSEERAQNTHEVLLDLIEDREGIVFNVRGYSEQFPLYDNETEEGRKKNRRVEISWPTD